MTIQQLFHDHGTLQKSGTGSSFLLGSADAVWYLDQGGVELFTVDRDNNTATGRRFHLCSLLPGSLLFGMDSQSGPPNFSCLATLQLGSSLYRLEKEHLLAALDDLELFQECCILVDKWLETLVQGLVKDRRQTCQHFLTPEKEQTIDKGLRVSSDRNLLWLQIVEGEASFLDIHPLATPSLPFPLSSGAWLQSITACRFHSVETSELLKTSLFSTALEQFHALLLHCCMLERASTLKIEATRLNAKQDRDAYSMRETLNEFVSILEPEVISIREEDPDDLLFSACLRIGKAQDITFTNSPVLTPEMDQLTEICKFSRVRKRTISFKGDWQTLENGPILGFLAKEQRPVALLPADTQGYQVFDPLTKKTSPVTKEFTQRLLPDGMVFYRPFTTNILHVINILKFSILGSRKDLLTVITMSILAALLGLIPPLASAQIFDTVIPGAEKGMLFQYGIALFAAAIGTAAFQLTRSFAMLRAETKMDSSLQFAVMDRLLSLAPTFFRQYTVGDLASRVNAITTIRQHLTGAGLSSLLTGFFSVFYLIVLFYYSVKLAFVAVLTTIPPFLVTVCSGYFDIKYGRELLNIKGRISGIVLQFLTGLAKLRVAGAEHRAFSVWGKAFAKEKQAAYKVGMVSNIFSTFHSIYPIIAIGIIYLVASFYLKESLSTGSFIAFVTAYGSFMGAILGLGSTLVTVLRVIPLYERARPILLNQPEISKDHVHPGVLDGNIEVNNVTFRYSENSPLILQNFSLTVKPGEFVAIVGPSGSGKSTLLRLLLGFEKPEKGVIFYSSQNLQNIDVQAVRQQIGTVLQGGRVIAGDIFVNIVGSSQLSIDEAWIAARQAGFEQDIRSMPMGMHTYVSEGGTNLSGGQRQRLLIARSFAMKPRIMFFDEATSALDNQTQQIVSTSMNEMHITRLVIAHRLSTIKNADTIYVINRGTVEQKGSYQELMQQEGLFAALAKRQLV